MSILHPRKRRAAIAFIFVRAVLLAASVIGWRVARAAERAEATSV